MEYSILGKTNFKVSILGMGGHEYRWAYAGNLDSGRFTSINPERKKVIARAIESGINYFDTTFTEETQSLGQIAEELGCKKDIYICGQVVKVFSKSRDLGPSGVREYIASELDTRLKLLGRDYFDIFVIQGIHEDYDHAVAEDVVEIFQKHQEAGKFRFIGVASHDHQILYDLLKLDLPIDMAMIPYNYAVEQNWGNQFAYLPQLLDLLSEKNIGTVGMKCFNWSIYGVPFVAFGEPEWDKESNLKNCVAWQTAKRAVHTTIIGVETVQEFENNLAGVGSEYDETLLQAHLKNGRDFECILKNYFHMSEEIQSIMLLAIRQFTEQDFGDQSLDSYHKYWEEVMERKTLPYLKGLSRRSLIPRP